MQMRTWQSVTMGVLLATTVGCGNGKTDSQRANGVGSTDYSASSGATGTSGMQSSQGGAGSSGSASSLTGCLQKNGNDYILTMIEQPSTSVGTSGAATSGSGATVAGEQMRAAARSYRLQSNNERQFDSMVGHQVRVTGTTSDTAAVGGSSNNSSRTSGSSDTTNASRPRENQLAQFQVSSVTEVAASCNQPGATGTSGTAGSNGANSSGNAGGQSDRNSPTNR